MNAPLNVITLAALAGAMLARPAGLVGQDAPPPDRPVVQVLAGNPDSTGHFALRITFPPGFHTEPHHHSVDLTVRVRSGRLMLGWGTTFDTTDVVAFEPGNTVVEQAARNHFDWFPEGGVLDLEGQGPMATVLVENTGKPLPSP
jgi:hypothetical protein